MTGAERVPGMEPNAGSNIGAKFAFQYERLQTRGNRDLPKIIIVAAGCLVAACPASARDKDLHHITCEMVRAYVAQVGVVQARAIALAYGMTASQEQRARRCLGS